MPLNKDWLNDEHKALHVLHYGVLLSIFGASGYIFLRIDSYAMQNAFVINRELKINFII